MGLFKKSRENDPPFNPNLDLATYAAQRVLFKIERYRQKSHQCRNTYLYMSFISILLSSAVPVLINLKVVETVYVTIISFSVVIIVSLEKVFHFRDRWKNYQATEEALRREKYLAETKSAHYAKVKSDDELFKTLVTKIEDIIKQERTNTISVRSVEITAK